MSVVDDDEDDDDEEQSSRRHQLLTDPGQGHVAGRVIPALYSHTA